MPGFCTAKGLFQSHTCRLTPTLASISPGETVKHFQDNGSYVKACYTAVAAESRCITQRGQET